MDSEFFIEDLERMVGDLQREEARHIINLSDWNPSKQFMNSLAIDMPFAFQDNPVSYIFSSDFDYRTKERIIKEWKYSTEKSVTFFNSGSESILSTLYFMAHQKCRKVHLLCPTYFSIEPICSKLSIECSKIFLERKSNNFFLPDNFEENIGNGECLWITNPIYCTGTLYPESELEKIKKTVIEKNLYLVNDESLCLRRYALSPKFESHKRYIDIITPHKALCTNGLKFSAMIISNCYYDIIDRWADILEGCLGIGAKAAINHFLSDQYDSYEKSFCKNIEKNRKKITEIISKYQVEYDVFSRGYLLSLYFSQIQDSYFDKIDEMKNLIDYTNAFFISGNKNSFSPTNGLSFRINLCRVDDQYLYALKRVMHYIQSVT